MKTINPYIQVLWTLKEERLLDDLEELITDDLFELVYTWVKDVPEMNLLKKSLDAGMIIFIMVKIIIL